MKIAIYGCGTWANLITEYITREPIKTELQIKYYVESKMETNEHNGYEVKNAKDIDCHDIDFLVISSNKYKDEMIEELKKNYKYPYFKNKIIERDAFCDLVYEDVSVFRTVTVDDGLTYIFRREDRYVGPTMRLSGKSHASEALDAVIKFAQKYAGFDGKGIFLDIGANIGTASIYAKHRFRDMRIIGFEPSKENYDVFRVNCILNGMENIEIENCALGRQTGNASVFYNKYNPGGSFVKTNDIEGDKCCKVPMVSLDYWLDVRDIDATDISFIWMDAEGYEDEIIIGAKKALKKKCIPMVHEFNPKHYIQKGNVDEYCRVMKGSYSSFIDINQDKVGGERVMSIDEIENWINSDIAQTDLFFF